MELCRQSPDGPEPPEATIYSVGRKDELSAVPPQVTRGPGTGWAGHEGVVGLERCCRRISISSLNEECSFLQRRQSRGPGV